MNGEEGEEGGRRGGKEEEEKEEEEKEEKKKKEEEEEEVCRLWKVQSGGPGQTLGVPVLTLAWLGPISED
ncbi:hypothetical protein H920_17445 [Fukomys damarensis]|uniref:Uncharacterized protein n=1 Tax=Fukomys damarensis TaxID=885580 RepID=A0A091CS33_FUKDA|nr:hypothetical protein H920_17445 [Fukomys damarensis]